MIDCDSVLAETRCIFQSTWEKSFLYFDRKFVKFIGSAISAAAIKDKAPYQIKANMVTRLPLVYYIPTCLPIWSFVYFWLIPTWSLVCLWCSIYQHGHLFVLGIRKLTKALIAMVKLELLDQSQHKFLRSDCLRSIYGLYIKPAPFFLRFKKFSRDKK